MSPGASGLVPGVATWVAAEAVEDIRFGAVLDNVMLPAVVREKTVHTLPSGKKVFAMCINDGMITEFNNRASACDGRIQPRKMNPMGRPELALAEAVAVCTEHDLGWEVAGPRTAKWCLSYLCVEGLGFEAHHERFRTLCKLDSTTYTTWGVQEHFQISMFLRQLVQVDALDGFNCLGVELMFRRLQTIEYAHSEKAREAEARLTGGKLALEEQHMFGSVVRQAGTLMICPQLLTHVKEELERDVQLQKNLRKAKEERELAGKKSKQEEGP